MANQFHFMEAKQQFQFQDCRATQKVFQLRKRIRAICGGTSASKTISILVWLIDYAQSTKGKKIDIMSESYPHLKDGAMRDFKQILLDRKYWKDACWNESNHIYTFETGSIIKFISIDKLGKAHGPRRDVLFINEANNIPFEIYDQLEVRTKEVIWLDWNPSSEYWYYSEIKGKKDHDFLTLTYLDCLEVLDPRIIESIESRKGNANWWKVYGLGELGDVEGRIYTDWNEIDELPFEARLWRRGIDFGYTNDPTVIIALYEYNGGYIIDEEIYQKGLSNKSIADLLNNQKEQCLVIADSAEPKSIDEISSYGISILGASKGQGSVEQGIQFVSNQKISITKRSLKTLKAYRNYFWAKDVRTNQFGRVPDDTIHEWSNSMDAIRYAFNGQPGNSKANYIQQNQFNLNKHNFLTSSNK